CEGVIAKTFNLDTHLQTHLQSRVKPFACADCHMSFNRKSHLTRHGKTLHEQSKDHVCNRCATPFTRVANLRKHVKKKHASN
ncbi:uncharacterized protein EV154DRAFT_421532, partial [Mucor mucedo]|uniref:uncharacterized protein n=1 Tax=Mucor mucedo TaxID=29922 RepID=UPI00221F7E8B